MIFLHETHAVIGEHETAFEDLMRTEYMPRVASDDGARLAWYLDSTHGSGEGYKVVTITALADAAAHDRHHERMLRGDLADIMRAADSMRYGLDGALLEQIAGEGPALGDIATQPLDRPRAIYRQDLAWPADDSTLAVTPADLADGAVIELEAAFRPLLGAFGEDWVLLLHRVVDEERWVESWAADAREWPGAAQLSPTVARRVRRTLRTAAWSPQP